MLKLLASIVLTSVILGSAILAYSRIYDSPIIHDGPVYPSIASSQTLLPINSNPFPSENCSDVTSRALVAAENLKACDESSQCIVVWNANLDSVRTINRANKAAFEKLANEVAAYCGEMEYGPLSPGVEYKLHCESLKCESEFVAVEAEKSRLIRESLSIVQRTNSIEAQ